MYPSQGTSAARVLPRLLPPERGFFPSGSQGVTPPLSPPIYPARFSVLEDLPAPLLIRYYRSRSLYEENGAGSGCG